MFNFIKSYWVIIVLALTATFLGIGKIYIALKPAPVAVYENTWNGITPGQTSLGDLSGLGEPVSSERIGSSTVYNYSSQVGKLKNQVYSEGSKVGLVKEQVWNNEKLDGYKTKYGPAEGEYFGDYAVSNYKVYVYAKQGLAFVAHTEDGYILEKWHFEPMSLQNFLSTWGKELSTEIKPHF